ncbi:8-amino-7-oxononanoate synthase [Amycolatopsis magusensis]|uniref:8-amino-7-oxononanoate synthase n=1 Tax=Amycolatopsis magusensis TaxID=882444 RepID=A0ABS4Q5I7_9PSEU|nr:8-amino-7-oxononanoate synthase [Amycolatopsis magusensis]MBP2186380.1 8-amino-7-oxononanoate synthase [Amycolatopsis magusensis]MDI5976158.1 8-amino-7-oxononanoate synthase [Amycolatopsis magusensis]
MNAPGPAPDHVFDWLDTEAEKRAAAGLVRRLRPRPANTGEVDLAGNDYLGLARDKRVAGATAAAALRWGAGATGSRLVTGSTELHAELEHELARFCGTQSALVFSSGFTANLGAVTALSGSDSAIVTDKYIHASLIEGCRLSRADVAAVAHSDTAAITHALATRRKPRALVVTDSVFSVDGDLAKLGELTEACRAHGAALLVDDAHGFGVLGEGGRGAVHQAGLAGAPDVVTTLTLSKSLGAQGGAVLGPRRVIKHLVDTARSFIFDTALAPGSAAAALSALNVLRAEPDLPGKVLAVASRLSEQLAEAGFTVSTPDAAVVSVHAPSPEKAVAWAESCAEQGVRVGCFRPPSVPDGISRLRLTARADLTESDVDAAVKVIVDCAPR